MHTPPRLLLEGWSEHIHLYPEISRLSSLLKVLKSRQVSLINKLYQICKLLLLTLRSSILVSLWVATLLRFQWQIEKLSLIKNLSPGFITNRIGSRKLEYYNTCKSTEILVSKSALLYCGIQVNKMHYQNIWILFEIEKFSLFKMTYDVSILFMRPLKFDLYICGVYQLAVLVLQCHIH